MSEQFSCKKTFSTLEKAINIFQQRHNAIASNISNLETPSYIPKDIDFKAAMAQALKSEKTIGLVNTNPGHMAEANRFSQETVPYEESEGWNGFNSVSIDKEMTKLIENNLMHRASIEALLRKITLIKDILKEGGQ
jgi:flagellar basal-body rod protein FlgB